MIFVKLPSTFQSFQIATITFRSYSSKHRPFRPLMMPRDNTAHIKELQKQRQKQRHKLNTLKYAPASIKLQVLGNGSRSDSRSIVFNTDHTNYLFNCGEGTQRLAAEHHAKLSKIEHIFVTKPSWENMGGIPGVLLTIQDNGVPKVQLHGPEGTTELMKAIDNFVNINELTVVTANTNQIFKDHVMNVEYLKISNTKCLEKSSSESDKEDADVEVPKYTVDTINFYSDQPNLNGKRPRSPNSPPVITKEAPLVMNRINTLMVYVCKVHPKQGSLILKKCVEQGVKTGPDMGKLKSGQDITLPNGKVVRSVDVVGPPQPGPVFIVLECPNEDWIDDIVDNPAFLNYQEKTAAQKDMIASYIIHFTPTAVLNNQKYKDWMSKFGKDTEHLILNDDNKGNGSESIHRMQHQLHLINGEVFPFLEGRTNFAQENKPESESNAAENNEQSADENELKIRYCKPLNGVELRPLGGFDNTEVKISPREYVQDALSIDGLCDALADLQTEINYRTKASGTTEEYPKIVFLGTGCSIPNKTRNTSGILLQVSENNNILLDCGEGTVGQLVRFFGDEKSKHILKHLNAIYVSHLHADHHLGFIGLLKQRERVTDENLFLIAPEQIEGYLSLYHHRFESICNKFTLVSNKDLLLGQNVVRFRKEMYERLEVSDISTTFVKHCPYAYGVAITLNDGRKISYSGDTIPCEGLVKLAKDSFLLIHEATMEDGLESEAAVKRHSTISQAVNVGMRSNAEFTMLTHFSQRYSKIPLLPSQGTDLRRVGIAYDFMEVKLSELYLLPLMYPSLSLLFSEFRALLDEKAAKRQLIKEQVVKNADNGESNKMKGRMS